MIRFIDSMDPTRIVEPVGGSVNGQTSCKVWFKSRRGLIYNGKTNIPSALFTGDNSNLPEWHQSNRVGFRPVTNEDALAPVEELRAKRHKKALLAAKAANTNSEYDYADAAE